MRMTLTTTLLTTAATALIGYCFYFDYKRQTDMKFRKQIEEEQQMVEQLRKESEPLHSKEKLVASAKQVLMHFSQMQLPTNPQDKEKFFIDILAKGEQLCTSKKVEDLEMACALFYAGLQVYPVPQELIQLYQKSLPERVFQLLVHVIAIQSPQTTEAPVGEPIVEEIIE